MASDAIDPAEPADAADPTAADQPDGGHDGGQDRTADEPVVDAGGPTRLAIIDAGMLSGWRRATPSLGQLHQAVFHLLVTHPGLRVAVVGDPALKHALSPADQVLLDADIEIRALVMAPAGTIGGFQGFLARIVEQATAAGLAPVVITDRAIADAELGRVRLDSGRWMFELSGSRLDAKTVAAAASASRNRRPPRRGGGRSRTGGSVAAAASPSA